MSYSIWIAKPLCRLCISGSTNRASSIVNLARIGQKIRQNPAVSQSGYNSVSANDVFGLARD
jgi:hypothetical protein